MICSGREVRNYLLDEDKIDRYRDFFKDSPYTVYREETNESTKTVMKELSRIDSCFMNDDADGITEIMKQAEGNPELSNWNKLRIINECKAALFELRI